MGIPLSVMSSVWSIILSVRSAGARCWYMFFFNARKPQVAEPYIDIFSSISTSQKKKLKQFVVLFVQVMIIDFRNFSHTYKTIS